MHMYVCEQTVALIDNSCHCQQKFIACYLPLLSECSTFILSPCTGWDVSIPCRLGASLFNVCAYMYLTGNWYVSVMGEGGDACVLEYGIASRMSPGPSHCGGWGRDEGNYCLIALRGSVAMVHEAVQLKRIASGNQFDISFISELTMRDVCKFVQKVNENTSFNQDTMHELKNAYLKKSTNLATGRRR